MVAESRGLLVHLFLRFLRNLAEYQLYRRVFKLLCHLLVCARAYIVHAQSNLISDNAVSRQVDQTTLWRRGS